MIELARLGPLHKGRLVSYNNGIKNSYVEIGRIKDWNDRYVMVAYKRDIYTQGHNIRELDALATSPGSLFLGEDIPINNSLFNTVRVSVVNLTFTINRMIKFGDGIYLLYCHTKSTEEVRGARLLPTYSRCSDEEKTAIIRFSESSKISSNTRYLEYSSIYKGIDFQFDCYYTIYVSNIESGKYNLSSSTRRLIY